jgi:hypothetical protein
MIQQMLLLFACSAIVMLSCLIIFSGKVDKGCMRECKNSSISNRTLCELFCRALGD